MSYFQFYPLNSVVNAEVLTFELPAWTSPSVYLMQKALISAKIKILGADGKPLPKNSVVAPINLPLYSAFEGK